jgi:hypothetical protein
MTDDQIPTLGTLSAHYESNGDPGAISHDPGDPGGASYGMYQLATTAGTPGRFVAFLESSYPEYFKALEGLEAGTPAFDQAWTALAGADRAGFGAAQHAFIAESYFHAPGR